jgi:hypothetical protein
MEEKMKARDDGRVECIDTGRYKHVSMRDDVKKPSPHNYGLQSHKCGLVGWQAGEELTGILGYDEICRFGVNREYEEQRHIEIDKTNLNAAYEGICGVWDISVSGTKEKIIKERNTEKEVKKGSMQEDSEAKRSNEQQKNQRKGETK